MMSVQLSEVQSQLINKIARQNGFDVDFEVETFPGSNKGDNFLGIITKVTIKNKERKLELILKSATTSEAFRKNAPIQKIYNREIYIYEKIFREFKKFQDEYKITSPFTGHAKLYGTSLEDGNECLVMENMVENGYKLWNRKIPMNAEHISAVFVEYAKFHAVSFAMKHKKPDLFEDLTKNLVKHVFEADMNNDDKSKVFIDSIVANGSKALEDEPELLEVLKKFGEAMPNYIATVFKEPKWNLVVNHGDCWCNNLMFKYETSESTTKMSKVCILDWQIAKKGSPAADLAYFFLAHSPKEILYDYQTYLKLYHDALCKNLIDFSCDPEEIFPYSLLEEHWRNFVSFGLQASLMIIKIMYCDTDEAPDFTEIYDAGKDVMSSFSFEFRNAVSYNQRIKDLMKFLVDTGLI